MMTIENYIFFLFFMNPISNTYILPYPKCFLFFVLHDHSMMIHFEIILV